MDRRFEIVFDLVSHLPRMIAPPREARQRWCS